MEDLHDAQCDGAKHNRTDIERDMLGKCPRNASRGTRDKAGLHVAALFERQGHGGLFGWRGGIAKWMLVIALNRSSPWRRPCCCFLRGPVWRLRCWSHRSAD